VSRSHFGFEPTLGVLTLPRSRTKARRVGLVATGWSAGPSQSEHVAAIRFRMDSDRARRTLSDRVRNERDRQRRDLLRDFCLGYLSSTLGVLFRFLSATSVVRHPASHFVQHLLCPFGRKDDALDLMSRFRLRSFQSSLALGPFLKNSSPVSLFRSYRQDSSVQILPPRLGWTGVALGFSLRVPAFSPPKLPRVFGAPSLPGNWARIRI